MGGGGTPLLIGYYFYKLEEILTHGRRRPKSPPFILRIFKNIFFNLTRIGRFRGRGVKWHGDTGSGQGG